ncbi:hypothetical protein JCM10450v2_006147 [Rhodotorula kratochvilovae]
MPAPTSSLPPAWVAPPVPPVYELEPTLLANGRLVTVGGWAAQIAAACLVQSTEEAHAERNRRARKAALLPPTLHTIRFLCLGSVGIAIRRQTAGTVWELPNPLLLEAINGVGLPVDCQPLSFLVEVPQQHAHHSLARLRDDLIRGTRARFEGGIRRTGHLAAPPLGAEGEVLVPRLEQPRPALPFTGAFPPPASTQWFSEAVSRAARRKQYLIPPTGSLVDEVQDPDEYVHLYVASAHVDLFYELHRLWIVQDRRGPHFLRAASHSTREGTAVVAAFNCMLIHETELCSNRLNGLPWGHQYHANHGPANAACKLHEFRTFAGQMLEAPFDDAQAGVRGDRDAFFMWMRERFGTATARAEFAKECVVWLVPYWPTLRNDAPAHVLEERKQEVVALFERTFARLDSLAHPVDEPI